MALFTSVHNNRCNQRMLEGGWPLHVDATGEAGRSTLLIAIAGWRQWVQSAWKISTERETLILPCLREVSRRFGAPSAAMRDLGVIPAIDTLVRNLEHDDYTRIVCGSLDRLPAAFAEHDQLERENKQSCKPTADQEDDLKTIFQLASALLSPADRRVVRHKDARGRLSCTLVEGKRSS